MKITAPAGKVVVVLDAAESITENGLIIPEAARKPSTEATVVASGHPDVASGDRVILSGEYAGSAFTVDDVEYVAVVPEEILAVIG